MKHRRHGRARPYTRIGIRRLPCIRCGRPANTQWQICADGRLFRPVCDPCDIALNRLVLVWAGDPDVEAKMAAYEAAAAEDCGGSGERPKLPGADQAPAHNVTKVGP